MNELKWWQKAVFYQIYPRSFADGNRDGIGDFIGMTEKLDYLSDLGINAVWLSPHFPSPQADCGYDISDYCDVDPDYGKLADFKNFLARAKQRDIKVIIDLVLNHTSDQHPWFIESRSSKDNPKRDWYIWKKEKNKQPPTNWESTFGGSAWQYDRQTDEYYYHFFLKEQPDLNWNNPEVEAAMWEMVRFWLDLGVDGFRLDAIGAIFEDQSYPDVDVGYTLADVYQNSMGFNKDHPSRKKMWNDLFQYQRHQPEVHPLLKKLRSILDEYDGDRMLIGEEDDPLYHGNGHDELHLLFNFPLTNMPVITARAVLENQAQRLKLIPDGAWPCNTMGNHDLSRVISRNEHKKNSPDWARLYAALMLTLKGTCFLYYGEEIGMTDYRLQDISQVRDTIALSQYTLAINQKRMNEDEALAMALEKTRDNCRTPMQWDETENAGFSPKGVKTWLPVNENYLDRINVTSQLADSGSLLNFYKKLIRIRKDNPCLAGGTYQALSNRDQEYLVFSRSLAGQTCLVILNLSEKQALVNLENRAYQILMAYKADYTALQVTVDGLGFCLLKEI